MPGPNADLAGHGIDTQSATNNVPKSLKYYLLGPSLTKAGQGLVDQNKVSEIIYNASKGSKFFNREEVRDQILTRKIEGLLAKKRHLDTIDLTCDLRVADRLIKKMESSRDLSQYIAHVDCDAFYAAVEQLERPELEHVPFAVGGDVLTTCNYVARQFGCRSGMAGFVAKKLCPALVLIRPNFCKYRSKAQEIQKIIVNYDRQFESVSIDEAYLNVAEHCRDHGIGPAEAIEQMRREIHQETGITVSAGIAANTKLAKICSNVNKPNGQFVLPNDRASIMRFMRTLPTRKVNGIGRVLERQLQELGISTCGDIYEYRHYLNSLFGRKAFEFLLGCYLGLGRTKLQSAEKYEHKSIGTESTFREMSDPLEIRDKLQCIAKDLEQDLRRAECKGRTLCLKVKLHTFEVLSRQVIIPRAICSADDIYSFSLQLLSKLEHNTPDWKLRLIGLRCTNLVSTKKPDTTAFFGVKRRRLDTAVAGGHAAVEKDTMVEVKTDSEPELAVNKFQSCGPVQSCETKSPGDNALGRRGEDVLSSSPKETGHADEDYWDCPVCLRPQQPDEKRFNDHIDLCLSRQTIRNAVQDQEAEKEHTVQPASKKQRCSNQKGARAANVDPKQKKLSFV
ncbi:hypothetical protein E4U43_001389 [Claviceps pusilla]|uniref:DNA polymerase kappa n=1 Tax=Claviceps pusilla TaxID=123648 RepID=A0A9P7SZB2_9HYPO|nr:hypothetical protein E4U43_001389 [Claviceps pusilla]